MFRKYIPRKYISAVITRKHIVSINSQFSAGLPTHTGKILVLLKAEGPLGKESVLRFAAGQKSTQGQWAKIKHIVPEFSPIRKPNVNVVDCSSLKPSEVMWSRVVILKVTTSLLLTFAAVISIDLQTVQW